MDRLALDDVAWAVVPDQRVRSVLLIGEGSLFYATRSRCSDVDLYGVGAGMGREARTKAPTGTSWCSRV
ncbi:MAG: hypothetical protein R3C32_09800 [Chloroflexota bacterium]